jgi:hypothetical protein
VLEGLRVAMEHIVESRDLNRDVLLEADSKDQAGAAADNNSNNNNNSSSSSSSNSNNHALFIAEQSRLFDQAADELEKFAKQQYQRNN